jgi:serine/threonine-protein kinase
MADANGSAPAPAAATKGVDPLVGRVINDRFKVVSLIARGGMGKVYRAEQAPLGREIALKVLNPNYNGEHDPEFHKRFFLEASICSKLTHPNTVTIFDYGRSEDDVYYIAMELLEGKTLHRALRESAPMEAPRVMHIGRQVCRSLREAHGLGVIHRDLKPANIYLMRHGDETDFVKVLDFGLVKNLADKAEDLTQTGLFMGSPKYMSPEQIRGEPVDGRSDIYALGVIMYEMLLGKVPFDRPNSVNILMAHVHEAPPPMQEANAGAKVPALLETIVMRCMAKSPDDRYASMDELLVALKQTANDSGLAVSISGEQAVSGEFAVTQTDTGSYPPRAPSDAPRAAVTPSDGHGSHSGTPSGGIAVHEVPSPSEGKGKWLVLVLLAAAVVAGVVLALSRGDGADELARAAEPVQAPAETEPVPVVQRVIVSLRSEPAGAAVIVAGREYGPTPAEVEWTGHEAARGREVTLRFRKEGFRDFAVTRTIAGDTLEVEATLEPVEPEPADEATPVRRPFVRRPSRPAAMMEEEPVAPVGPIKGYKNDPY